MHSHWIVWVVALGLAVGAPGCSRRPDTVSIAASTSCQVAAEDLAAGYAESHPPASATVHKVDSAFGLQAAVAGVVNVAVVDALEMPVSRDGVRVTEIGRDGIAIIVHPMNPLANLSLGQLADLLRGNHRNWADVGGASHDVNVILRETGSGTRSALSRLLGNPAEMPNAVIQDSSRAVIDTVANDANAIGYVSSSLLEPRVKAVAINGTPCARDTIVDGSYPLSRPVYLLVRTPASKAVEAFSGYVMSHEGRSKLEQAGLVANTRAMEAP